MDRLARLTLTLSCCAITVEAAGIVLVLLLVVGL